MIKLLEIRCDNCGKELKSGDLINCVDCSDGRSAEILKLERKIEYFKEKLNPCSVNNDWKRDKKELKEFESELYDDNGNYKIKE